MSPTVAKHVAKIAVGVPFTLVLGLLVKANHAVDDKVDAHYDKKKAKPEPSDKK